MELEIRLFASLVEAAGRDRLRLDVDPQTTPAELWDRLGREHPALGRLRFRPWVACDRLYAPWDRPIGRPREIAFLPPVSGG